MRLCHLGGLMVALGLLSAAALAQSTAPGAITATPLAPPPGATGQPLAAPAAPATGQPADTATSPPAPPAADTAPPAFTPAPAVPFVWQPGTTAELQVLDKVDAQATTLTVKVGASVQYRSLTIAVRACDASTKDERQDATAFLDITDSHPDEPAFHGWILKSDPSVSMLQHPIYDVRILGCHA